MADESKKGNIKQEFNIANTGLNLDNSQNNIKKGKLSYALNAAVENFDSNSVNYQNEPGNEFCFDFPDGYKLVGKHFIPEQDRIIFFLTIPGGSSEIGQTINNSCVYDTLVNDECLNFDIHTPILKVVHKITNFGTELYWPDNNGRRYLDIDNIPYIPLSTSEVCDPEDSSRLDCNKLLLQPDVNIPYVSISDVISGGEITSGVYQFTIQYSDAVGNPLTAYYGVTNPTPIADIQTATVNFNLPVGKSIIVDVENLDPLGQYEYFNLAVIKTVNNISTPELVGTYFIDEPNKKITYTGQNVTNIQLSINDIFEKFVFYDNADYVTTVQDVLVWKGMTAVERINYQKIANEIKLKWQSYRIPAGESYADEANAANYRGYLRDEVYAFEIIFLLKSGKETDGFHIPGRRKGTIEVTNGLVDPTNPDYIGDGETPSPYWMVYNTATVETTENEYITASDYKGPYQTGEFAYWESTEEYPCDVEIWGDLANQKIRHHKFPDAVVSPIIESSQFVSPTSLVMEDVAIFPIGVKIESSEIENIINRSELTAEQKAEIVGYRIARADRGVNKSIVAKGMLRNVGKYQKDEQDYFYPNYPYNDLNPDEFLNKTNNALLAECETFTVEIFNMTDEDDQGNPIMKVEFVDCITSKTDVKEYTEVGTYTLCSLRKPRFVSPGTFNKVIHRNEPQPPIPTTEEYCNHPFINCEVTDGNISYSNYDAYDVGKAINRGCRIEWEDIVMGTMSEWFDGVGVGDQDPWRVHVIPGTVPVKIDGPGEELIREKTSAHVRVEGCYEENSPLTIDEENNDRQIFNSPETSFGQPFLGSILKLESVMYGAGKAHFVEVKDNAKYRLITKEAQEDALKTAEKVAALTQSFNLEAMFAVYNAQMTIFRNEITKRNFAKSFNSIASYNYSVPVPNDAGIKQRNLDIKRYLIPEVLNVGDKNQEGDNVNINNYNRETSVYLKAKEQLPVPHDSPDMVIKSVTDRSRFLISKTLDDKSNCSKPEKEEDISVVSYYGSLKNLFVNQYGQIYSYETIDTGFVSIFGNTGLNDGIIWGGDTFIGRFAYKTKVPFFIDNRVDFPDDSDIFYDEIGNIGYPKYWHSSRSILETWQGDIEEDLKLSNFISYKAHNFDCPNNQDLVPEDADPETNPNRTFYDGYFYMFAYGVPSFYCESSYNLDLRTAFNNKEGDFWPHVSTGIPDEWVQEKNVPIIQDNTYNYNVTFSKQNKETVFTNLPADWGTGEDRVKYPFRAVYSDKQNTDADNRVNNWLTYRAVSYFDFPQNYGGLTALDGLKNSAILARFENKSLLYNNLLTIDTTNPQAAYIGNANLFEGSPPIDYADTDQGYVGSQNKFLLKTPYGAVSIDAKRGQVFLINGSNVKELSVFASGLNRWFIAHLPFEILKYYPEINIDNHYNSVGLHGVYDSNYERLLITKIDYVPLNDNIVHRDNKWYVTENNLEKEIYLIDSDYFCNVSWTVSFNFNTNSWISFHSYIPNFYVGEHNFFYSGLNYCPNDFDVLVGVIDNSLTTTTTTTIRIFPSTTTTTSTTIAPFDCAFDVNITIPDCDLEGTGEFIDGPPVDDCTRPLFLTVDNIYWGYDLTNSGTSVNSTGSQESACSHINYYSAQEEVWGYIGHTYEIQRQDIQIGGEVYLNNLTQDCSTVVDGWYFTEETASSQQVFRIESGVIVEIADCNDLIDPTTTTTTTTLNSEVVCYDGVYTEPNASYPLGGIVNYYDEYGVYKSVSGIWAGGPRVSLVISSLVSAFGVLNVPCGKMIGVCDCESDVVGDLGAIIGMQGVSNGSSTVTADLGAIVQIQGVSNSSSNVIGDLGAIIQIEGISNGSSTVSGTISSLVVAQITGVSNGSSSAAAWFGNLDTESLIIGAEVPWVYNPETTSRQELTIPSYAFQDDIAHTANKLWEIDTNPVWNGSNYDHKIVEWDITLNPFVATYNRDILIPFRCGDGLFAIDDTTLIVETQPDGGPYDGACVINEVDISGGSPVLTPKITLPYVFEQTNIATDGDFILQDGASPKLIITIYNDWGGEVWLAQYDWDTGKQEILLDVYNVEPYLWNIYGLAVNNGKLYAFMGDNNSLVYEVGITYPWTLTLVDTLINVWVSGASQLRSSINIEMSPSMEAIVPAPTFDHDFSELVNGGYYNSDDGLDGVGARVLPGVINGNIRKIRVRGGTAGSPNFNMECELWKDGGSTPTNLLETSSNTLAASDFAGYQYREFEFNGDYYNTNLWIVIRYKDVVTHDGSNYVRWRINTTDVYPDQNLIHPEGGTYWSSPTKDFAYLVIGNPQVSGTLTNGTP